MTPSFMGLQGGKVRAFFDSPSLKAVSGAKTLPASQPGLVRMKQSRLLSRDEPVLEGDDFSWFGCCH